MVTIVLTGPGEAARECWAALRPGEPFPATPHQVRVALAELEPHRGRDWADGPLGLLGLAEGPAREGLDRLRVTVRAGDFVHHFGAGLRGAVAVSGEVFAPSPHGPTPAV